MEIVGVHQRGEGEEVHATPISTPNHDVVRNLTYFVEEICY